MYDKTVMGVFGNAVRLFIVELLCLCEEDDAVVVEVSAKRRKTQPGVFVSSDRPTTVPTAFGKDLQNVMTPRKEGRTSL